MIGINPLVWQQLTYQKSRLFVSILGVTFSVSLMFIQMGFRDGLFENSVTLHHALDADLVLIHQDTNYFFDLKNFPRRFIYNILGIIEVKSAQPFYFYFADLKNPQTLVSRRISIGAFPPDKSVFKLEGVQKNLEIIKQEDTFLFDRLSRSEYGPIASQVETNRAVTTELANRKIKIGGLFSLGGGVMSADGLLVTSDLNYSRLLNIPLEKVNMGVIKIDSGIDPESVIPRISAKLPSNLKVITLEKFMEIEKEYWSNSTPIGFIFNLGTIIGCLFGGIIVYQILYTQISDNLYIYATFKAIGYTNFYLVGIVLKQAMLISIMGYLPGFIVCLYLYDFVRDATRLPMSMTFSRALIVGFLTIAMCSLASLLAMNKLRFADPAELFR